MAYLLLLISFIGTVLIALRSFARYRQIWQVAMQEVRDAERLPNRGEAR